MKILKTTILLLLFAQIINAQCFEPKFEHLSSANGLSNNTVNCILRDHNGFMWFGTYNGLSKYDGYDFTTYTNKPSNKFSLSGNRVFSMLEDKNGLIYVGTWSKGLDIYDDKTDNFKCYKHDDKDTNSISSDEILCLYIDSKERIWIGTRNGGLNLFDPLKGTFKQYIFAPKQNSEKNDVFGISELPNGNLILATRGSGICFFDIQKKEYQLFHNPNNGEDDFTGWEKSLYRDKKGIFWITAKGSGFYKYNYDTNKVIQYKNNPNNSNSLSSNIVAQIIEYRDGKYLIATDGGGLNYFDTETNSFAVFTNNGINKNNLSSTQMYCLYLDPTDILWIGTFGGGLNIYDHKNDKFATYKPNPTNPTSLSHRSVLSILQDRDENIWIGTDGGGLNLYNPKINSEKFIHYKKNPNNPNGIGINIVKSIFQDSNGSIWLGSWLEGLEQYNPKTGIFKHYTADPNNPNKIMSNSTWAMIEDDEKNLWLSSFDLGVDVMNLETGKIRHYRVGTKKGDLTHRNTQILFLDSKKHIWLGTEDGGLLRYNKEKDNFIAYRNDSTKLNSLSSDDIRAIFEDSDGRLWVGTQSQGLNLFDEKSETFTIFTEDDGLIGNSVYGILEDNNKNLWISTTKGISKFNYSTHKFTNYTNLDGLIDADFNYGASLKAKDGRFYFGGLNGFNAFYPEKITINPLKPKVYITNLKLFNQSVTLGDKSKILDKPIIECTKITVSHTQNVLTFQYTGINYTLPIKNQFAYQLIGFDTDWNYVKFKREVTYTNLDPGEYTFRVKASNNDGVWNEEGTSLKVVVLPPFWATWWFRTFLIGCTILLISMYISLRIRKIKNQRNLLKKMVDERTIELQETNSVLYDLNRELSEVNILLEETNEEISEQKEQLIFQNDEIKEKSEELEMHRNHLEELVEERTEELLTAKEKAEESERLKASFLANMSHEIRTPLNAIVGFSNLLTLQENTPDDVADYTSIINKNTEDLLMLIDDILDLSTLEAKQSSRNDTVYNVNHFIDNFFKYWKTHQQTDKRTLVLENNVLNPMLTFVSDEHKMRQILSNLMGNACKFTDEGSVTLSFSFKNGEYIFAVKDSGIGIAQKNLDVIFDWFRKIEDDRNKLFRGNGLGLAISTRLAELLGGKLWAESELNVGSTFYFSIPKKYVKE